jgi:hypothetical protein
MDSVQREAQITLALADLANQEHPNFKGTARAYKVNRTILYRRFDGVQRSYAQCHSETHQNLTSSQEKVLIDYINQLTDLSSPPTSQYVKNFAEELLQEAGLQELSIMLKGCIEHTLQYGAISRGIVVSRGVSKSCI